MFGKFLKYYFPVLAWCGVVYYFSSVPNLRVETNSLPLEVIVRKFGHLGEYMILAWLIWRIFFGLWRMDLKYSFPSSLFLTSIYAASDEFHQTFVVGRAGKIEDVLYDIVSAFIALQFISLWQKKSAKKILVLIAAILLLILVELNMIRESEKQTTPVTKETEEVVPKISSEKNQAGPEVTTGQETEDNVGIQMQKDSGETGKKMPAKILIDVPFTSQAPLGKWDAYHEEACEETSLLMVEYFLQNKKLTPALAEKEIQAMIAYEIKTIKNYEDSTAVEIVALGENYYGIKNLHVIYDFTAEDLKKYLAQKKPIIVPAAGRLLGNPNFTAPGPLYHNLVLVGYDGDTIITNDPGTRKGQNYKYNIRTLYDAIHDFPGDKNRMEMGRKAMIVLE